MAIVRLEFELDSDVYPELHEALLALRSTQSRAERLRQLATLGLVWENVRIYGAEAIGPNLPARPPTGLDAPVAMPAPKAAERAAKPPKQDKAPRGRGKASTPVVDPRGADFVDLAIDAPPAPVALDADEAGLPPPDFEQIARELPVLMDVVAENELGGEEFSSSGFGGDDVDVPRAPYRAPPAVPPGEPPRKKRAAAPAREPVSPSPAPAPDVHGPTAEGDDEAIHLKSLAQKPAARSRLMRMKERGLFRNDG